MVRASKFAVAIALASVVSISSANTVNFYGTAIFVNNSASQFFINSSEITIPAGGSMAGETCGGELMPGATLFPCSIEFVCDLSQKDCPYTVTYPAHQLDSSGQFSGEYSVDITYDYDKYRNAAYIQNIKVNEDSLVSVSGDTIRKFQYNLGNADIIFNDK